MRETVLQAVGGGIRDSCDLFGAAISGACYSMQHAFEMLLKAALVQAGKPVFDEATGRSVGFERCIGLAMSDDTIKLSETDAGTLRDLDMDAIWKARNPAGKSRLPCPVQGCEAS